MLDLSASLIIHNLLPSCSYADRLRSSSLTSKSSARLSDSSTVPQSPRRCLHKHSVMNSRENVSGAPGVDATTPGLNSARPS